MHSVQLKYNFHRLACYTYATVVQTLAACVRNTEFSFQASLYVLPMSVDCTSRPAALSITLVPNKKIKHGVHDTRSLRFPDGLTRSKYVMKMLVLEWNRVLYALLNSVI